MRVRTPVHGGVLDTTLCDKDCQWLATGQWFSPGTPVSSTKKNDHHDITEILLKVALNTTTHSSNQYPKYTLDIKCLAVTQLLTTIVNVICIFILFSVQLHIAHLLEVQGKIKQAKEAYEHFITLEDIDKSVKATALKQLGNFSCAFCLFVMRNTNLNVSVTAFIFIMVFLQGEFRGSGDRKMFCKFTKNVHVLW